jgi:glycosyltransferase involved in cell wall biosynthesis
LPLRIAGPILNEVYFREQIAPNLGEGAIHTGHLAHGKLAQLVGGARAFMCTPLWDEPYGLVVAEALACGVPVAAFARGAIPDILDASCGVLAVPDDVASLARSTLASLSLDRRACRRRAEQVCNADRMIDAYEALYRRLAAGGEGRLRLVGKTGDDPMPSVLMPAVTLRTRPVTDAPLHV